MTNNGYIVLSTESDLRKWEPSVANLQKDLEIFIIEGDRPKPPSAIALKGGTLIGCLWSTASAPFDIDIGVEKSHRGQGVAFRLLATWLRSLPTDSSGNIKLDTTASNTVMQRVLEFACLRNDGSNNFRGDVEVARLVTYLEFSTSEITPGLALWLHPASLQHFNATCHCLDRSAQAQDRHPFICVDIDMSARLSTWMPLNSRRGNGRYPILQMDKSGSGHPGDTWLTENSYYHPAQAWTCDPRIIRGCLSGERTTPTTRNRVDARIATEMLTRARRLLKGI